MNVRKVSDNAVRRLPRYIHQLDTLHQAGINTVQSKELAQRLGITSSQVRQDLSYFGRCGLQGSGYPVDELRRELAVALGMNRNYTAILVGFGQVGLSLAQQFPFAECCVELICAFDSKPPTEAVPDLPILPIQELKTYLQEHHADIAILTVPGEAAGEIAKLLECSGINAIWNFTGVELSSQTSSLIVETINFADSLLCLGYHLTQRWESPVDRNSELLQYAG